MEARIGNMIVDYTSGKIHFYQYSSTARIDIIIGKWVRRKLTGEQRIVRELERRVKT